MPVDRPLSPCACFNVRSAARAITALYDDTLDPSGIRTTQFAILTVIHTSGALTMQELAGALGLDASTMTRTLAPLESADLVRTEIGEDRRVKRLVLTEHGSTKLAEAYELWEAAQQRLRDKLGADVFERMVGDLADVTNALRA